MCSTPVLHIEGRGRTSISLMPGVPVPKLVTYDKLIEFVNSLDIGTIKDIADFCIDVDEDNVVNGAYRELEEYLLILAEKYIDIDIALGNQSYFNHFGSDPYLFRQTNHPTLSHMERYARKRISDIAFIERKIYDINGNSVKFSCNLVPSDMKWLAHYSGELTNSADFFPVSVMLILIICI